MVSASTAFLDALNEIGVSHVFANFGSDHPAIIESLAEARFTGRRVPTVITCPNEMVALSAAQGFAQASGKAQAVLVHVECGTQALAGAVHNIARARMPVLILAGASPFTQEGELPGSRNEFIQWLQDVPDQRGIVRGYVKYENEIRTGRNIKQLTHRAMQIARSDPKGPVYLMAAREVLEAQVPPVETVASNFQTIAPAALDSESLAGLSADLLKARRPVVVTSYIGRNHKAVEELVRLCGRLAIAVHESAPSAMNFPATDPMYQGNQWNEPKQSRILAEADLVLAIDTDVPWIPTINKPNDNARIYHIDIDPLKQQMPLWYIAAAGVFRVDAATALRQINQYIETVKVNTAVVEERRSHYGKLHEVRRVELAQREVPTGDVITPAFLVSCVRNIVDENTIVLNEGITNYGVIADHLQMTEPGSLFASGGSSLGWHGGAAIGMKLAFPDKTIIAMTGDGSFMFSVPSTVHWMARKYETPFLQVVFNNRGWKAPKMSTLAMHPEGYASRAEDIGVSFDPPPDYSAIAAASGGAYARIVRHAGELQDALKKALDVVRVERRCAVLDVWLPHL